MRHLVRFQGLCFCHLQCISEFSVSFVEFFSPVYHSTPSTWHFSDFNVASFLPSSSLSASYKTQIHALQCNKFACNASDFGFILILSSNLIWLITFCFWQSPPSFVTFFLLKPVAKKCWGDTSKEARSQIHPRSESHLGRELHWRACWVEQTSSV